MVNLVDHVNVWRTPRAGGDGGIPPEVRAGRIPDEAGIDKAIYRHKLARLASDPGLAVRIVGVNALCLLYPIVQAGAHALNPSLLFAYAGLGLLLLAWRRWRLPAAEDPRVVPVLLMGVYVGVSLVWQAQPGYRTPVEPLILLAGLLGWDIWIRAGRSLPRCGAAVAVYALAWGARLLWMSSWKTAVVAWLRGVCVR